MDDLSEFTDTPDVRRTDEEPPDFGAFDSPDEILKDHPIRERMFDVILQLRTPTKVSEIAERAACDTETARDYLDWFASMGMIQEYEGRPVRYRRNDAYLQWRRIEQVRATYSDEELVQELTDVLDALEEYRDRFGADSPDDVSLVEVSREIPTEEAWETLSEWKTLRRRAAVLDAARRDEGGPTGRTGLVDV